MGAALHIDSAKVSAVALVALVAGGLGGTRWIRGAATEAGRTPIATATSALQLHVPHVAGSIMLDGDMDDPGWSREIARTGAFVDTDGNAARPYSDARFVWGDGHLYVALYAADEDIRASRAERDAPLWLEDSFHLLFRDGHVERSFDVSPIGAVTDGLRPLGGGHFDFAWNADVHVSHELDGTPNDPADDDEEWVIEMAIPFEALGIDGKPGDRVALSLRRCDVLRSGAHSCGAWGDGTVPSVLVLDEGMEVQ